MTVEPDRKKATTSQSRHAFWGAPVAVALTFLLIGCYTILKHPITSEEGLVSQASHQEYYRDRCLDCHADYATYPYGFFYGSYPEYYFEYPRWGHYYAYPWWWDHYWYDNDDEAAGGDYSEGLPESQPKASRRGDLVPPYVGGTPAIPTGGASFRRSDPGATQTKGGTESETGTASPGTSTEKVRVKKADESSDGQTDQTQPTDSKEKKKASRRGGIKP